MTTAYDDDVAAWAHEQVELLRAGQLLLIDVEHIAEEIEDMNISYRHQLASRFAVLLAHLLKWQYQPERRGSSWRGTIRTQRAKIARLLERMPSLKHQLAGAEWLDDVWEDAVVIAVHEAHLQNLPPSCPWSVAEVLSEDMFPDGCATGRHRGGGY